MTYTYTYIHTRVQKRVEGGSRASGVKEAISQVSKSAIALACYDRRRIDALSSREIRFPAFVRDGVRAGFGCQVRIQMEYARSGRGREKRARASAARAPRRRRRA